MPVLPLQRNEIVSESRIAQIIERARRAADKSSGASRQGHLFADLEKTLRESDRAKRVEFYTHDEGWKNKLICGDWPWHANRSTADARAEWHSDKGKRYENMLYGDGHTEYYHFPADLDNWWYSPAPDKNFTWW